MADPAGFSNIGFEEFRKFASDTSMSKYEKIGFPDSYRQGSEEAIFADITSKLSNLHMTSAKVLDIGPGCSDIPNMLIDLCERHNHNLTLIDSREMLDLLPSCDRIEKLAAMYPNCPEFIEANRGKFDVVLCYSVLHYIIVDVSFFRFIDLSLSLLSPSGQMLIGDIPNVSKRKRFFASDSGIRFHQAFMKTAEKPDATFNRIEHDQIDDAVVMAVIQRARLQGFDAYVLPQPSSLPMANRREDILISRP
ncbi:class I SAM-dependent methyltransferase [Rhizobium sp. RAF56]|uniref:class I SAM-dependent methyltransferase n=1 Tax=Rhizobium sp. RAF56 TaxID=3233062 RepID=UPI003F99B028